MRFHKLLGLVVIFSIFTIASSSHADVVKTKSTPQKTDIAKVPRQILFVMLTPKSEPKLWSDEEQADDSEETFRLGSSFAKTITQNAFDFWVKNSSNAVKFVESKFYVAKAGTAISRCDFPKDLAAGMKIAGIKSLKTGQHLVVANTQSTCGWAGIGDLYGNRVLLRSISSETLIHELGHNFGLSHSSSIFCKENNFELFNEKNCEVGEYEDFWDVMDNGAWCPNATLGATQRALAFNVPKPQVIQPNIIYLVDESAQQSGNILYVLSSNKIRYFIEYRVPTLKDCMFVTGMSRTKQVEVRMTGVPWFSRQGDAVWSVLITRRAPEKQDDPDNPIIGNYGQVRFTGFNAGDSFSLPGSPFKLEVLSTSPSSATFSISRTR